MRVKTRDDPAKLLARRKEANTHAACRDVAILQYGRQSWPYRRWHDEPVTCHAAPTNRFRPHAALCRRPYDGRCRIVVPRWRKRRAGIDAHLRVRRLGSNENVLALLHGLWSVHLRSVAFADGSAVAARITRS